MVIEHLYQPLPKLVTVGDTELEFADTVPFDRLIIAYLVLAEAIEKKL
mgnify:CR=1 FL=1